MQIQIGKTKIEAGGGFLYIQAFGREVFVKKMGDFWTRPCSKLDVDSNCRETWLFGLYIAS